MHRILEVLACICLIVFTQSCDDFAVSTSPSSDYWQGKIITGNADVPFRFILSDTSFTLVNAEERISLSLTASYGDTTQWAFPYYVGKIEIHGRSDDSLWGEWHNKTLPSSRFTFHAVRTSKPSKPLLSAEHSRYYNVHFNDGAKAVGAFNFSDSVSTGTFLTETGDYRYLHGQRNGHDFWLSTFDGDHLYLVTGTLNKTGITHGEFYSRHKKPVLWTGIESEASHLQHPDSLTHLNAPDKVFRFSAQNFQGEQIDFDQNTFHGNVTVVSLFGSWCPNCHDELRFHRELSNELNHPGLQFIPVAFERSKDIAAAEQAVDRVFKALQIPFKPYYGGIASKKAATEKFTMLDTVRAFPTSLFIDKKGVVRKIHTGFSGPGTGHFFSEYKAETTALLDRLLKE